MTPSEKYPHIHAASFVIALDNGGINRTRPAYRQKADFDTWLAGSKWHGLCDLDAINAWLGGLSKENLETVCVGEMFEMLELMKGAPEGTDAMLTSYFEEVC